MGALSRLSQAQSPRPVRTARKDTVLKTEFPADFVWGAATSSYQIEGAWEADGKGESIWDRFSHTPGKIEDGSSGDDACDHYHRWPEDIGLMKSIGIHAYRFSAAWARILPRGRGAVNEAGIDFYSRLVDGLLEAGITPYLTLYHWDLPQALEDAGGWPARPTADAFAEYTDVMTRALGDRVRHWVTLNEPWVSAYVGYEEGRHAPGHTSRAEMVAASHHLLLAHGKAVPIIRGNVPDAEVGLVLNLYPVHAASPSRWDRRAAVYQDGFYNRWYLDPISGRGYPCDTIEAFGVPMDFVQEGDMEEIAAPLDFLGLNYYLRHVVRSDQVPESENLPQEVFYREEHTEMGWEVYPEGLYEVLGRLHFEYQLPALYITENGVAFADPPVRDGTVQDDHRIRYLHDHFKQAARAIEAGVPLRGYFVWSLLDNFEWSYGYTKRFGLIHVDLETQARTLKASAGWYRDVIAANALTD
jgi:beta-glucosidase